MTTYRFCPLCARSLEHRPVAGRSRLACSSAECGWVFWDNPLPVLAAIVQCGSDVVLVRNQGWPEKMFGLVTGFLERDELPEDGLLREISEELGVQAEIREFLGVYPFVERNELLLVWHVSIAEDARIVIGDELAEYRRIPVARLRPWPMGTGPAVRDWLQRQQAL